QNIDVSNDPAVIVDEFKTRFYDTELFFDPYAKGKFAHYLFNAYEHRDKPKTLDIALRLIEEAGLFIEASHACNERLQAAQLTAPANPFTELLSRKVTAVSA
ncbi:MAG: nitrite/sulfite reductase, partial [Anaerolineae bacterium]|nr:nitrite/sulfite reductase [Anaerolineae bacterium]